MCCLHDPLLQLRFQNQIDLILVIDHIIHHSESVITACTIQNLTCLRIFGILNQQLSLPILRDIQQWQRCWYAWEGISYHIMFALHILNLKIISLKLAHPFLLLILQWLLLKEESKTVVICLYLEPVAHKILSELCLCLNFAYACITASISLSYTEYNLSWGNNFLLSNAMWKFYNGEFYYNDLLNFFYCIIKHNYLTFLVLNNQIKYAADFTINKNSTSNHT